MASPLPIFFFWMRESGHLSFADRSPHRPPHRVEGAAIRRPGGQAAALISARAAVSSSGTGSSWPLKPAALSVSSARCLTLA